MEQLRKNNQSLKEKVADLQSQLNDSWAENDAVKRQEDGDISRLKQSPTVDRKFSPSGCLPHPKIDLETRFQEIRAEDIGNRAFSKVSDGSRYHYLVLNIIIDHSRVNCKAFRFPLLTQKALGATFSPTIL